MDTEVPADELANFCPNCGRPYGQVDRFCASCGRSRNVPAQIAREGVTSVASATPQKVPIPASRSGAFGTTIAGLPIAVRPVVIAAVVTYAATVVLSVALSAILIFAAASALNLLFGGSSAGSSTGPGVSPGHPTGSDIGTVFQVLLTFTSYAFSASHFGPLEASGLGGATFSVVGVGSLTIAGVALLLSFAMARRMERTVPAANAGSAFVRGAILGIPYGLGALALYFPSVVTLGSQQLGISIHASLLGVFLAAAVAAVGGGLGAASIRFVRGAFASSAIRGAARATAAIAIGAVLTAVVAAGWIGFGAITQTSASTSTTLPSPSTAAQQLGWSLVALIPFYVFNGIALIWSATLDGSLFSASSLHLLIFVGPMAGVLLGAVKLRGNGDRVEQASYAVSFAAGTGVIGLVTTPAIINGPALLPSPWTGVLIALLFAAAAALAAPYLLAVSPVRAFAASAPLTWVMKPLLGIWPADAIDQPASNASSKAITWPRLRLGRLYAVAAALLVTLLSGSLIANSQLAPRFTPGSAAVNYLGAQSRGDADAMWALMEFDPVAPSTSSRFLTKGALQTMLGYGDNRDITNVSVATSSRDDDANYTITAHLTRAGQPTTVQLRLRRDQSRSNWLVYPYWRVVVAPSVILFRTYPHAGEVTLDGIDTGISGILGSVDVIPGVHRVQLVPTGIFAGDTKQIDAFGDATVAFDLQLSGPASVAATMTIDTFFDHCAKVQELSPAGCPNSTPPIGDRQSLIGWTLVGDPSANVKLSGGDAVETVIASGTWKMHVSFDYWSNSGNTRVQHWEEDAGGDFTVTLLWNGSGFDVTSHIGATSSHTNGTSSVPNPSITAAAQGAWGNGGHAWQVVGQYFTPGERVSVFLYDPYNAATWIASYVPGVSVGSDGSFTVSNWRLDGTLRHGTAMIKACDTANVCATVVVTVP